MKTGRPAALARVLQLCVPVLLLWTLAGLLPAALGQEICNAAEVDLGEGDQHTFAIEADGLEAEMFLFGKRGSRFYGFAVKVLGKDGNEHIAQFSAEEEYFPDNGTWYEVHVSVQIKPHKSVIEFGLQVGSSKWTCERDNAPQGLQSLSVVPHGASSWATNFPNDKQRCPFKGLTTTPQSHKLPTCNKPEHPTSSGTAIGVTLAALVVFTLVAAAVL